MHEPVSKRAPASFAASIAASGGVALHVSTAWWGALSKQIVLLSAAGFLLIIQDCGEGGNGKNDEKEKDKLYKQYKMHTRLMLAISFFRI